MMKTAEPGTGDDDCHWRGPVLDGVVIRRLFPERIVNAVFLMISNVFSQESAKMALIQRDDIVEDLPAGASDRAFRSSILPGRLYACPFRLQARGVQERHRFGIELRIMI